jgi:hypothetical protein
MSRTEKKKYLDLLRILKKLNVQDRSKIVPYLKADAIDFVCECFHNVLYTDLNIKNKGKLRSKLKKNCSIHRIKTIANKSKPLELKIKALKQEGSGLGLILSAAIPFLTSLFTGK